MWQINRITKDTLLNISKYSNKVIKISQFLQNSNQPFIMQELLSISDQTDQVELLNAFDKDLTKTVNDMFEIQKLLITVDDNGYVKELNNEEKNISNIFGSNYNIDTKELKFPTIVMTLGDQALTKEEIKVSIIKNVLNMDLKRYKELMKIKDTLKDINKEDLNSSDDKINYLLNKTDVDFITENIKIINSYINSFVEIRKNLSLEEKELLDKKIMSGRTMVDGVLPNSTYISKEEGVYQISSNHKKDYKNINEMIENIQELIKESKYVSCVEIDQDTDLEKFINLLKNIKNFHLNIEKEFELKTRKLGNYRSNGVCLTDDGFVEQYGYNSELYNIVSVDVNTPSSLVREATSLVDLSNKEFSHTPERKMLISHFRNKVTADIRISDQVSGEYFASLRTPKSIIARLGEIGYILNKYNYTGHQSKEELNSFFEKVKLRQAFETIGEKEIPVVHNIEVYKNNSGMYFDLENLNENELNAIKSYYQSYYNVLKDEFIPLQNTTIIKNLSINDVIDIEEEPEEKEIRKNRRYSKEDNPISKLNLNNVKDFLNYNDEEKIFENKELADYLSLNFDHINRSKMSCTVDFYKNVINVLEEVFKHAKETGNIELEKSLNNAFTMKSLMSAERSIVAELQKDGNLYKLSRLNVTAGFDRELRNDFKNLLSKNIRENNGVEISDLQPLRTISGEHLDKDKFEKRMKLLISEIKRTDGDSLYFDKIMIDISNNLTPYAPLFTAVSARESVEKSVLSDLGINIEIANKYYELIKEKVIKENEDSYEQVKKGVISDVRYGQDYNRNPRLKIKTSMFNEDFLLNNHEKIINSLDGSSLPKALQSAKGLNLDSTEKQKISFLNKLPLKSLDLDTLKEVLESSKITDIKKEEQQDLLDKSSNRRYLGYSNQQTTIRFIQENELKGEDVKNLLEKFKEKISPNITSNEEVDVEKSMFESFLEIKNQKLESLKASENIYSSKYENEIELMSSVKAAHKEILEIIKNKGVSERYLSSYEEIQQKMNKRFASQSASRAIKFLETITFSSGRGIENILDNKKELENTSKLKVKI